MFAYFLYPKTINQYVYVSFHMDLFSLYVAVVWKYLHAITTLRFVSAGISMASTELTATFSKASSGHAYEVNNRTTIPFWNQITLNQITSNQSMVQQLIKEGKYRTLSRRLDPSGLYARTRCKWSLHWAAKYVISDAGLLSICGPLWRCFRTN